MAMLRAFFSRSPTMHRALPLLGRGVFDMAAMRRDQSQSSRTPGAGEKRKRPPKDQAKTDRAPRTPAIEETASPIAEVSGYGEVSGGWEHAVNREPAGDKEPFGDKELAGDRFPVVGIVLNSRGMTDHREAIEKLQQTSEEFDRRVGEPTSAIELLYDVASMANSAQDVMQALAYCLGRLTRHNGWRFGHALMPLDVDGRMALACHCYPDGAERFCGFREATKRTRFVYGEGLVGCVLASREPVWTSHLPEEIAGARSTAAVELGLQSSMAFPVLVGEEVAAVLEFFSDEVYPLDSRTVNLMSSIGMQLGRVIERANLQEHLLTIADQMQQRIAQDLHDDVGQEMTGLALKAETLAEVLGPDDSRCAAQTGNGAEGALLCGLPHDARRRCGALAADILTATKRTQGKIRSLAHRILPIEIELNSLPGALERLANESGQAGRVDCTFQNAQPEATFDARIATQLYRIAQEALANAIRHAQPRKIHIKLAETRGGTQLCITDDGRGMPAEVTGRGLGLRIMHYRAGLLGAMLDITPGRGGQGTAVTCQLPTAKSPPTPRKRRREICKPKS
jgi:signal transduction histidine kinase